MMQTERIDDNPLWYTLIGSKNIPDGDEISARFRVNSDSPWFEGHFPDDPVLPGIAQLGMVIDLISSAESQKISLTGLSRGKFKRIVRPDDLLEINACKNSKKKQYTFKITCTNEEVCTGIIRF